ncbi:MAG TPA: YceI family protein [Phenylobacterium sp.]|uniref:YceI family protein n=1 Tax=Phenylobacterium sp. TaxID=1871053 RepID=UPI002CB03106|nr:YceI family protein [Phenylobacterium sp.]HSV01726.1 YceI family protein [Phenylobacterium sp.]
MTPNPRSVALPAVIAAALAAGAALAQTAAPAGVQAGTYAIEPIHTRVLFAVSHTGNSTWYGDFNHASGTLTLDPKNPAASKLEVSVPVDTISTTNAVLDKELKGADWFDAAKFPTMTFRSTRITPTGPQSADVAGELTLHGVTKPVVLHARFKGAGPSPLSHAYMVGFDATGEIKRSDFGITKYAPVIVGDDVQLILSAPFVKKPA